MTLIEKIVVTGIVAILIAMGMATYWTVLDNSRHGIPHLVGTYNARIDAAIIQGMKPGN